MRWFVETLPTAVPASTSAEVASHVYVVEAPSWQAALAEVIGYAHSEVAPLSVEPLEDGYLVIDPSTRQRARIRHAPDDAALTMPSPMLDGVAAPRSARSTNRSGAPSATSPSSRPRPMADPTMQLALPSALAKNAPAANEGDVGGAPTSSPSGSVAYDPFPAAPRYEVLATRVEPKSSTREVGYWEIIFALPEGISERSAALFLRSILDRVITDLRLLPPGKQVTLMAFDVRFHAMPPRPALATLVWNDREGDATVTFPARLIAESQGASSSSTAARKRDTARAPRLAADRSAPAVAPPPRRAPGPSHATVVPDGHAVPYHAIGDDERSRHEPEAGDAVEAPRALSWLDRQREASAETQLLEDLAVLDDADVHDWLTPMLVAPVVPRGKGSAPR